MDSRRLLQLSLVLCRLSAFVFVDRVSTASIKLIRDYTEFCFWGRRLPIGRSPSLSLPCLTVTVQVGSENSGCLLASVFCIPLRGVGNTEVDRRGNLSGKLGNVGEIDRRRSQGALGAIAPPKNPRLAEHQKPKAGRPYSICTFRDLSRQNTLWD